jgi:hypothetical protein
VLPSHDLTWRCNGVASPYQAIHSGHCGRVGDSVGCALGFATSASAILVFLHSSSDTTWQNACSSPLPAAARRLWRVAIETLRSQRFQGRERGRSGVRSPESRYLPHSLCFPHAISPHWREKRLKKVAYGEFLNRGVGWVGFEPTSYRL